MERSAKIDDRSGGSLQTIVNGSEFTIGVSYHRVRRPDRIAQFRSSLIGEEILKLGVTTADLAGHIFADLELAGQPIGRMDPMIAAIAIENGLTLVTGNTAHYVRITALGYALKLDNWRI